VPVGAGVGGGAVSWWRGRAEAARGRARRQRGLGARGGLGRGRAKCQSATDGTPGHVARSPARLGRPRHRLPCSGSGTAGPELSVSGPRERAKHRRAARQPARCFARWRKQPSLHSGESGPAIHKGGPTQTGSPSRCGDDRKTATPDGTPRRFVPSTRCAAPRRFAWPTRRSRSHPTVPRHPISVPTGVRG